MFFIQLSCDCGNFLIKLRVEEQKRDVVWYNFSPICDRKVPQCRHVSNLSRRLKNKQTQKVLRSLNENKKDNDTKSKDATKAKTNKTRTKKKPEKY